MESLNNKKFAKFEGDRISDLGCFEGGEVTQLGYRMSHRTSDGFSDFAWSTGGAPGRGATGWDTNPLLANFGMPTHFNGIKPDYTNQIGSRIVNMDDLSDNGSAIMIPPIALSNNRF